MTQICTSLAQFCNLYFVLWYLYFYNNKTTSVTLKFNHKPTLLQLISVMFGWDKMARLFYVLNLLILRLLESDAELLFCSLNKVEIRFCKTHLISCAANTAKPALSTEKTIKNKHQSDKAILFSISSVLVSFIFCTFVPS
jgi:hypothetical protein